MVELTRALDHLRSWPRNSVCSVTRIRASPHRYSSLLPSSPSPNLVPDRFWVRCPTRLSTSPAAPTRCLCGASMATGRHRHHCWECVVALPLRDELVEAMGGAVVLFPQPLWLGRPSLGVRPLVWDVVCLAAVAALGLGLRLLFRVQAGAPAGLLGPPQCVCRAGAGGAGAVPADHPFLAASLAEEVAYGPPGCRGVARRLSRARFCG